MKWLATAPLSKLETRSIIAFFFVLFPLLGALVEMRSAYMLRRMGDLDCFLRAAWAVRHDADPYAVISDNDWHYNYPPFYAILMTPLADTPHGETKAGHVPYPVSVYITFLLSLFALFWSADALARAIEERSPDEAFRTQPAYCRRWWVLRLWPMLVCFLPIGHTMMRGQVNLIVMALLIAALAGWMRGQSVRAGWWLGMAICIKVIPAYLLVYPLWKRDFRAVGGCLLGCFVGLVALPLVVFGPTQTVTHYQTYGKVFLGPMFNVGEDDSRQKEIVGVNSTDSIGVKNALHNWMYPNQPRPDDLHVGAKIAYLVLGIVMTFLVLRPRIESPIGMAHQFGALIVQMTIFSPVSHSHYLAFCMPIVMSLLAWSWQYRTTVKLTWPLATALVVFAVTQGVAQLPELDLVLKDRCVALFTTLPLWAIPVVQLWRGETVAPSVQETRLAA
ncbi:MAG: DUF2029 domain-containing protein [Planctomycetes bacterium]|nr:DUF2029 domain-containing protein [Planctomycetota bacterium]